MGYIFAGAIFDLLHVGIITVIAQWVLYWLGLQHMRQFSPLFDKARPWLLAGMCISLVSMIGFTSDSVTAALKDIPLVSIAEGVVWLWFWYLIFRAIESLEPVYGDLHSGMLFKLYYIWVGLFVVSYGISWIGLLGLNILLSIAIVFVVAQVIVAILRIIYLYRAWKDFNTRREQLSSCSYDTFSEEKKQ